MMSDQVALEITFFRAAEIDARRRAARSDPLQLLERLEALEEGFRGIRRDIAALRASVVNMRIGMELTRAPPSDEDSYYGASR